MLIPNAGRFFLMASMNVMAEGQRKTVDLIREPVSPSPTTCEFHPSFGSESPVDPRPITLPSTFSVSFITQTFHINQRKPSDVYPVYVADAVHRRIVVRGGDTWSHEVQESRKRCLGCISEQLSSPVVFWRNLSVTRSPSLGSFQAQNQFICSSCVALLQ